MGNLELVKSEQFGSVQCDLYNDGKAIWLTRRQIGEALEYENPSDAIKDIHNRHKERIGRYSRVAQIALPSGGNQNVTLYSAKGVYEICRWSQQAKADAFFDWVYELLEKLRKGKLRLSINQQPDNLKQQEIEARLVNAQVRKSNQFLKIADRINIQEHKYTLQVLAVEALTGKATLPLLEAERKTYSATDIGKMFGVSSNKIGKIANANNLKTPEYGKLYYSKSEYSVKEVETWRYYENAITVFKQLIEAEQLSSKPKLVQGGVAI